MAWQSTMQHDTKASVHECNCKALRLARLGLNMGPSASDTQTIYIYISLSLSLSLYIYIYIYIYIDCKALRNQGPGGLQDGAQLRPRNPVPSIV